MAHNHPDRVAGGRRAFHPSSWGWWTSGPGLAARSARWALDRAAYTLALLPLFTDWIDTGHWPQHPRELATETAIGLLILIGVSLLYRRGDRFQTLAETDALTGLGNRRRFRGDLEVAVARAHQSGQVLALAFVDVDRFKEINDRWGHAAGDEALRQVARAIQRLVRQGVDGAYRLGGDEFAVLLLGADGATLVAKLRRYFEKGGTQNGPHISCSVGVVELRAADGPGELVRRADELMYAAKRGGVADGSDPRGFFGRVGSMPGPAPTPRAA
jgi:diguanylate cyclase (GGDEF)-like protein